jgi:hypothetical protein
MKKIISGLFLFSFFNLIAQSYSTEKAVIFIPVPVLYMGHSYKIEIGNYLGRTNYRIEGKNVKIDKDIRTKEYVLNCISIDLDAEVYYIDNVLKDTFSIKQYDVARMPKLQFFWGTASDGDVPNCSDNRMSIGYDPEVYLTETRYKVEQWIVSITGNTKSFSGSGEVLSEEVINALKKEKKGTIVTISIKYSGPAIGMKTSSSTFKI